MIVVSLIMGASKSRSKSNKYSLHDEDIFDSIVVIQSPSKRRRTVPFLELEPRSGR